LGFILNAFCSFEDLSEHFSDSLLQQGFIIIIC
jgi:hypothetical protein